jgi:hypothetical protein
MIEDHDNQYDIILSGDAAAIARLTTIRMPSSGGYLPVVNPGGLVIIFRAIQRAHSRWRAQIKQSTSQIISQMDLM